MKSQKTAEESQKKENIINPRGLIVPQTQSASSLGSRNKLVILVSDQNETFFPDTINTLFTELVRSRWLDITLIIFLCFQDREKKKGTRPIYSHLDRTVGYCSLFGRNYAKG